MGRNENFGNEEIELEPFSLIRDIVKNWWVILLGAIGAALLTTVVVRESYQPQYTAAATFVVSSTENSNAYNNLKAANEMAGTLQTIIESNSMKKIICKELNVTSVNAEISTEILGETNLLVLRVTSNSSQEAMKVIRVIMNNYTKVSYYALGNAVMDVLEEPEVPVYPNNSLNTSEPARKAFLITAVVLAIVFGLISCMRDSIKQEEEIEKKLDASSLGAISYESKYKTIKEVFRNKKGALLVNSPLASFSFVENYKNLAVKMDYKMKKNHLKSVVVTSLSENEGKSTVAANLAISLANQGKKVILMEGDLRRPSQFLIFDKNPMETQEIGEYLSGNAKAKDLLLETSVENLYLILGKNCYSSSTEKVQSSRMENLIRNCEKIVDYVIIDSPPVGLLGDAEVLAEVSGAVILVAKQNYMLAEDLNETIDTFRGQCTKVIGVVLNRVQSFSNISGSGNYGTYGKYGNYANYMSDRGKK